jgi:hypothetical protein
MADVKGFLEALGQLFGNSAQMRAQGLATEAQLQNQQTNAGTSRYQALVNANRLQNVEQPSANLKQAGQGSLMSTWQPVNTTPANVPYGSQTNGAVKPTISGGPSITPEMRATGASVASGAMNRQAAGNPLNTSLFPSDAEMGMSSLPQSSALDKILSYAGLGTSIASQIPGLGASSVTSEASSIPTTFATGNGMGGTSISGAANLPSTPAVGSNLIPPSPSGGVSIPMAGGGGGTGVGGNGGWLAEEFLKMLMRQGMFAGGGSPWDEPVSSNNGSGQAASSWDANANPRF